MPLDEQYELLLQAGCTQEDAYEFVYEDAFVVFDTMKIINALNKISVANLMKLIELKNELVDRALQGG